MPGVFCPPELAARIDRAEGRLCAAIARECRGLVIELGGGVAVFADRTSPTNKMIGIGFSGRVDDRSLSDVEERFAERQTRLQAEISTLADPAVLQQLVGRGYVPGGFENLLGHSLRSSTAPSLDGVIVSQLTTEELPALADVMAEGFSSSDTGGGGGRGHPASR
jgi:hypothetical protein